MPFLSILIISNFKKIELIVTLILLSLYGICCNTASVSCFGFWPWGTWGLEPAPLTLETRSLSPRTTREVLTNAYFLIHYFLQHYWSLIEMHFKHLEILPFKTYDSLVLSIFAVCCPQSSLSSECSQHSRKKPHTHWLAARAHLPWPRPGEPRLHCLFLWSGLFWTFRPHRVGFTADSVSVSLAAFCFPLLLPFFRVNSFHRFLALPSFCLLRFWLHLLWGVILVTTEEL